MLCVTNGDSAAGKIRALGLPGEVLPWRDVLHEGPVPAGLDLAGLREARVGFPAERGWGERETQEFVRRDSTLAGFGEHEEVVLAFEHYLYDQLQLVQLLDWFGRRPLGCTRLTVMVTDEYLGSLSPERLGELFAGRQEVSSGQLRLGREAWAAFSSRDPTRVSALPFMADALLRHLRQFPSTENGINLSETRILRAVSRGSSVLRDAYVASHQEPDEPVFLGDTVFAWYVEGMSQVPRPLLVFEDGREIRAPRGATEAPAFWEEKAEVTDFGLAVLAGEEDHIRANGIDRWLGGVHLRGAEAAWRWDEGFRRVRRSGV